VKKVPQISVNPWASEEGAGEALASLDFEI